MQASQIPPTSRTRSQPSSAENGAWRHRRVLRHARVSGREPLVREPALAGLRTMLEQQRAFRLDQLAELASDGDGRGHLGSSDPEILRSLVAGARAALTDVEDALARMASGSYGRCVRCADEIGLERLEILPQTALCLSCMRQADLG